MRRLLISLIFVFLGTAGLSLAACTHITEPQELAIVSSALYDYDGKDFILSFELIDAAAAAKDSGIEHGQRAGIVIKDKGHCMESAISNISMRSTRKIFVADWQARIITERFAKSEFAMKSWLDFLTRQADFRENAIVFVVHEDAADKLFEAEIGVAHLLGDYLK